jgi:hypothetical protein
MKNSQIKLTLPSITAVLVILLLFSSCNSDSSNEASWFRDPQGHFHTNDVERAQKEIPFTIILPQYLPEYMDPNLFKIIGPFKDAYLEGIEIEIEYITGDNLIYISEQNVRLVMEPNEEMEPVYYNIAGTRVLRQQSFLYGASETKEGLRFDWNQDGLTFAVSVFSISEEEGLKIVESMVKQINQ